MFYIFEKGKLIGYSEKRITQEGAEIIEKDFSPEEVKKLENGYLYIDGEFIPSEESIKNEILEIKAQCGSDIYAEYSIENQANATANVARINALCMREDRKPTTEENAKLDAGDEMFLWIHTRKEKCKADIIALITPSE